MIKSWGLIKVSKKAKILKREICNLFLDLGGFGGDAEEGVWGVWGLKTEIWDNEVELRGYL